MSDYNINFHGPVKNVAAGKNAQVNIGAPTKEARPVSTPEQGAVGEFRAQETFAEQSGIFDRGIQQAHAAQVTEPQRVSHPTLPAPLTNAVSVSNRFQSSRRFSVALSFPGENRDYVKKVVAALRQSQMPRERIFYDAFYTAELARLNLDEHLQKIYHDDSDLMAIFISKDYQAKQWCGLEWRAIRDVIKSRRGNEIMIFRFDDTQVGGLFSIDGYVDLSHRDPETVADLILERLDQIHNRNSC